MRDRVWVKVRNKVFFRIWDRVKYLDWNHVERLTEIPVLATMLRDRVYYIVIERIPLQG